MPRPARIITAHLESIIYVVRGKARMRWGEHLEFVAEAGPGDFIYVPPYVPHQEINAPPRDETWNACWFARAKNRWSSTSTSSRSQKPEECAGSIRSIRRGERGRPSTRIGPGP